MSKSLVDHLVKAPGRRRAAQALAEQIRQYLAEDRPPGRERLTSEADLVQGTGYSRATVREALRILEDQGLISVRPGPAGGIFAAQPDPGNLAQSIGIVLEARHVELPQLLEARRELEATAARLAASRATPEDLTALRATNERLAAAAAAGDLELAVAENLEFHLRLVDATHNEVLALLIKAMRQLVLLATRDLGYSVQVRDEVVQAHGRIIEAVAARDDAAAERRARRHLEAFDNYLSRTRQWEVVRQRFRL